MDNATDWQSWLALILSLAVPGLGHTVRRRWLRSFIWFGTVIGALVVLLAQAGAGDIGSVGEFVSVFQGDLDASVQIGLLGLHGIQAVDAFALEPRETRPGDDQRS